MFRHRVVGTAVRNALGVATLFLTFIPAACSEKAEEAAARRVPHATMDRTVLPIAEPQSPRSPRSTRARRPRPRASR